MSSPTLADYAFLLHPVEGPDAVVVEAPADWTTDLPDPAGADVVLWGRVPFRSPPGATTLSRHAAARERALRSLAKRTGGFQISRVHRLAPPPGPAGRLAAGTRDFLLGGALVELRSGAARPNRVEAVAEDAGVALDWETFAPGSDGAATIRGRHGDRPVIVRGGPAGSPSDPSAAATVLETLGAAGIERVPEVVTRGEVGGVAYACETLVGGRRPRRVDDDLLTQVASFLAQLPRGRRATQGLEDDLAVLGRLLPAARDDLENLGARLVPVLNGVPSVVTHGDLWAGNLFVQGGRLTGVIDWDGARLDGIPGTDLLHLVVSTRRGRAGGDIGEVWVTRPWRSDRFLLWSAPYWGSFELDPTKELLDAAGAAWWAGWLRQALERHERRLTDERWLAANVTSVLADLRAEL